MISYRNAKKAIANIYVKKGQIDDRENVFSRRKLTQ
jgi:hypothetical protein